MVKMMVTVVFVFTLCWLPFNVLWVVQETISDDLKPYLWFALHWLAMSHACYNPIIYCYMNSRFRTGFIQAFSMIPCCRWCLPPLSLLHPKSTSFPLTTFIIRDSACTGNGKGYRLLCSTRRKLAVRCVYFIARYYLQTMCLTPLVQKVWRKRKAPYYIETQLPEPTSARNRGMAVELPAISFLPDLRRSSLVTINN